MDLARQAASSGTHEKPIILVVSPARSWPGWLGNHHVRDGFDVVEAAGLAEADHLAFRIHPDLLLLDQTAPVPGNAVAHRPLGRLPIVFFDLLGGWSLLDVPSSEAADVIPASCCPAEAAMRLRSVLRRLRPTSLTHRVVVGELELDHRQRRTFRNGRQVPLSFAEFNLLGLLLETPGRTWSYAELDRVAWGMGRQFDGGALKRVVQTLRRKLGDSEGRVVQTVRGIGIRLAIDHALGSHVSVA